MKPNVIAITVDANQFPPAAFLADKLARLNPRDDTDIVIFSDSADALAAARAFGVPANLQHLTFSGALPSPEQRISGATFMRLFVPEVLGAEVERILYLDADLYPENDSFFRLFDLDMLGHAIAAVRDVLVAYAYPIDVAKAGVQAHQYLNAGVLLIDRRRFLDADLRNRIVDTSVRTGLSQGAINRTLAGGWLELSPAMNMAANVRNSLVGDVVAPAILHFMGPTKPWHGPRFGIRHPARNETEDYLLKSPWAGYLSQQNPIFGARPEADRFEMPASADMAAIADYLRAATFADVVQGITRLDLAALKPADAG
jgi:lipopolysaccharide biosynthesis glycosyltransferase